MPFSWSVGVSPTPTMSPTSSVARCCVLLWIFHKNNIFLFQGLASHIDKFVEEEVDVRHIPQLSDGDLRSLGFLTIGSRQQIRSAATSWVPQVICLCSFHSHVLKKVLNKYNDMFFFSWEIWYKKSFIYVSFHRSPVQTPWRWIGLIFRNNVHLQPWVDWKILTTQLAGTEFSRRSQQGGERDSNAEDGEREVLWIDLVLVNWFDI